MRRINIEAVWWTDHRRYLLANLLGDIDKADILAIKAWRLSQDFWGNGRKKVPVHAFEEIKDFQLLLDVDLAIKHGFFVYVRGSRQFHEWYALSKESASKGGKSRANRVKRLASEAQATLNPLPLPLPLKKEEEYIQQSSGLKILQEIWNENCGSLSPSMRPNPKVAAAAAARWKEAPEKEYWIGVAKIIAASDFCNGRIDGRTWKATFTWFLKPDTHTKVMEGTYGSRTSAPEVRKIEL